MSVTAPLPEAAPSELTRRGGGSRLAARLLGGLAVLFVGRVVVQLVQFAHPVDALPAFEEWQSGTLSYGVLVMFQLAIVGGQVFVVSAVAHGRQLLSRAKQRAVTGFAVLYLAVMVFRLTAGLTFADRGSWLDAPLPTVLHLVLASFLLVWMHHESGRWSGERS